MSDDPVAPLAPWKVTATRHVFKDRWLSVRADDCVTSEGVTIAPYYVVEYPDFIQIVAIDREDHVLLVEQYRHGWGGVSLELPAGAADAGDPDPIHTGKRELLEETGYASDNWQLIASLSPNPANHSNRSRIVLAQDVVRTTAPHDDPTERIRLHRLPVTEVVRRALNGEIVQSMQVAALALALSRIGKWSAS